MRRVLQVRYLAPLLLLWGCSELPPLTPGAGDSNALIVEKTGTGDGVATSDPAGIDCGADCMTDFEAGTSITLTAVASEGSTFAGWQGPCEGSGECTFVLQDDSTVTAEFLDTTNGEPGDPSEPGDDPGDPSDPGDDPNDPSDPGDPGDEPGDPPAQTSAYGELLFSEDAYDFKFIQHGFASTVHLDGNRALVITEGGNDVGQGGAFMYVNSPTGWKHSMELPVVEIMGNESTGGTAALSNGYAAVRYHCGTESSDPCFEGPHGFLIFEFGSGTWTDVANQRPEGEEGTLGLQLVFAGDYLFATDGDGIISVHHRDDGSWPVVQELDLMTRGAMAASEEHFLVLSSQGVDHYQFEDGEWLYQRSFEDVSGSGRWLDIEGDRFVYSSRDDHETRSYVLENSGPRLEGTIGRSGPVALAGEHLLIGAPENDDQAEDAGAVHIHELVGEYWMRVNSIYANDPGPGHNFGNRLDASEEFAIVGAFEADYDRNDFQGAVYIFGHPPD